MDQRERIYEWKQKLLEAGFYYKNVPESVVGERIEPILLDILDSVYFLLDEFRQTTSNRAIKEDAERLEGSED